MEISMVTELIYRGPQPTSESELSVLKEEGITTIINLEHAPLALESNSGMKVIQENMGSIFPPKSDTVDLVLGILAATTDKLFVGCRQGRDRTGYVVAAYRCIVQGWDFEKAYQEMCDEGFHRYRYWFFGWKPSLKAYVVSKRGYA